MTEITLLKPAAINRLKQANPLAAHMSPAAFQARIMAPVLAVPTGAILHVAAANATRLPAGHDASGDGSEAAPFATLTKALSQVPQAGNVTILADGSFAENNSGRLILAGDFALPVLIKPAPGAQLEITNASGTNGVICVRGARARNIQMSQATIRPSTDGCPAIWINPTNAASTGGQLLFHDCEIICRSHSSLVAAIRIESDFGLHGLSFTYCRFTRAAGASQAVNPQIITTPDCATLAHSRIGFWHCRTTDGQFSAMTARLCGIKQLTMVGNAFTTGLNHACLIGTDSVATGLPETRDVFVYDNDFIAQGVNAHGLELGEAVSGIAAGNRVTSVLQGIVAKGTQDAKILQNAVRLVPLVANGAALHAKAAHGTLFEGNAVILEDTGLAASGMREAADGAHMSQNTILRHNYFEIHGVAARALEWRGTGQSAGGAQSVENSYILDGAALGILRGVSVSNLSSLQAAWGSAGLAGDQPQNDAQSHVAAF